MEEVCIPKSQEAGSPGAGGFLQRPQLSPAVLWTADGGVQLRSLDGAAGQLSLTGRLGSPVGRLWVGAWGPNKRLLP